MKRAGKLSCCALGCTVHSSASVLLSWGWAVHAGGCAAHFSGHPGDITDVALGKPPDVLPLDRYLKIQSFRIKWGLEGVPSVGADTQEKLS